MTRKHSLSLRLLDECSYCTMRALLSSPQKIEKKKHSWSLFDTVRNSADLQIDEFRSSTSTPRIVHVLNG